MRPIPRRTALAGVAAAIAAPALGHSTGELEQLLGDKEQFFQAFNRETPAFTLSGADGNLVRPADLSGKVVVLHFVYASCPDVCPLHAEKLAEVQEMVNRTPMKDLVQFVSITTDPGNDTPDLLRDYGPAHGLDAANWMFLTIAPGQPEDTTRDLAKSFGHRFDVVDDGAQVHGVVTHVIDMTGGWRANFYGLRFDPTNMVLFINALTNDSANPHGPSEPSLWEQVKELFN
ncbi:MAG: SCO family protein [Paracoccaceae bacterium]